MTTNAHEYTVSELAFSLKRTVEETYGRVRVRGELGRVTIAKSGHCYLDVKDDKAVINSIIWKGVMSRLTMRPEEGMEVICDGKLSTYPGRSNYQLVIDNMELAGAGALMALFDKRKKMLAAEGLFDSSRKVELPFMPKTIGVVTSPTGSVIRDILHRIQDRFPAHVLVWPVLVQGEKAAEQITSAITGFNHGSRSNGGGFPRPDVIIVARGGGSMEDLWCFNEESVARAAAASTIPLISAVGHETDWTLIDYVADYRAPTPTGAAEVAVPVRADWLESIADYGLRLSRGLRRNVNERKTALSAARLPRLQSVLSPAQQQLDLALARLPSAARLFEPSIRQLERLRLPAPRRLIDTKSAQLTNLRLRPETVQRRLDDQSRQTGQLAIRAQSASRRMIERQEQRLLRASKLLDAYSYQGVLERGYALVQNETGGVIRSKDAVAAGEAVRLTFSDGARAAVIDEVVDTAPKVSPKTKKPRKTPKPTDKTQADLF
ncbi:MAG: exodeoxyribonuclease VII large subunit [Litorimonas sp.]